MEQSLEQALREEGEKRDTAVRNFVERIKNDRYILACFLYGSMARGDYWFGSDIDVLLVTTDETVPWDFRALRESGYWIEANIMSRNRFREACEGNTAFSQFASIRHSGRLIYCEDSSLQSYFDEDGELGTYEMLTQAFRTGAFFNFFFEKLDKYCGRGQRERAYNTLINVIHEFASLIIILNRRAREREVIEQALEIAPELFSPYPPVLYGPIPEIDGIEETAASIRKYILDNSCTIFQLLIDFIREEGREMPLTAIHDRFASLLKTSERTAVYGACEMLCEAGYLESYEYEIRLTKKSSIQFYEPSYRYTEGIL